jgi:hypothetical protein
MSNTNTGGPAFPGTQYANGIQPSGFSEGMTLRDYFAAKAMQGALSRHGFYDDEPQFSVWCYETADAMLKAREA